MLKLAGFLASTFALDVIEVTDDFEKESHVIWDSYMEKEEPLYNWYEYEGTSIKSFHGGQIHFLNVTSQQWLDESKAVGPQGSVWSHIVAVNIPKNLKHTNISLAYATGWCNERPDNYLPEADDEDIFTADQLAHDAQMIAITVFQIPNCHITYPSDPKHKARQEDGVLAWAWREFHGDPTNYEWLPRMPMAKAVFQSMRAAQDFVNNDLKVAEVDNWMVAGASKRGWTTWMVGVTDCKNCVNIAGIMPLVPIMPNLLDGAHQQWKSYGGWTFAFYDYVDAGIMQWLDDEIFGNLTHFLDPLSYKDRLAKIPKYIMLSSDDEFMMFDWTSKYFDQFAGLGETKLLISPNSEHSLATAIPNVVSSVATIARSIAEGKTAEERPSFDYEHDGDKTITITIPEGGPKPTGVYLRHAETFSNIRRDFRWIVKASDDNKNCSLPWIHLPKGEEDDIMAKYNFEGEPKDLCLQLIDWHKQTLKETEKGSGVYVGTAPEPKKDGHWVGYFIEVVFDGDTDRNGLIFKNEYVMTSPGWVHPDTYPFEDCYLDTCTNTEV